MKVYLFATPNRNFPDTRKLLDQAGVGYRRFESLQEIMESPDVEDGALYLMEIGGQDDFPRAQVTAEWVVVIRPHARFLFVFASKNLTLPEGLGPQVDTLSHPLSAKTLSFKLQLAQQLLSQPDAKPVLGEKKAFPLFSAKKISRREIWMEGPKGGTQAGRWQGIEEGKSSKVRWRWIPSDPFDRSISFGLSWVAEAPEPPQWNEEQGKWIVKGEGGVSVRAWRNEEELYSIEPKGILAETEGPSEIASLSPKSETAVKEEKTQSTSATKKEIEEPPQSVSTKPSVTPEEERALPGEKKSKQVDPSETRDTSPAAFPMEEEAKSVTAAKNPSVPKEEVADALQESAPSALKQFSQSSAQGLATKKIDSSAVPNQNEVSFREARRIEVGQSTSGATEEQLAQSKGFSGEAKSAEGNLVIETKESDPHRQIPSRAIESSWSEKPKNQKAEAITPAQDPVPIERKEEGANEKIQKEKPSAIPASLSNLLKKPRSEEATQPHGESKEKNLAIEERGMEKAKAKSETGSTVSNLFGKKEIAPEHKEEAKEKPKTVTEETNTKTITSITESPVLIAENPFKFADPKSRFSQDTPLREGESRIASEEIGEVVIRVGGAEKLIKQYYDPIKKRPYFLFSLAELGDRNSIWYPLTITRVYLSADARYKDSTKLQLFPVWAYTGELAPEFMEDLRVWKFYDSPPLCFGSIEECQGEVKDFMEKLMYSGFLLDSEILQTLIQVKSGALTVDAAEEKWKALKEKGGFLQWLKRLFTKKT